MATDELRNHIKDQRALGIPKDKVIKDLSALGKWSLEDIQQAFMEIETIPSYTVTAVAEENKFWKSSIPTTNNVFLVVIIVLLFGVNPFILVTDSLDLGMSMMLSFYYIMFVPFLIFLLFYFNENRRLSKKFAYTDSILDLLFFILILVRNIVIVLNVIPYVQLAGAIVFVFGIIPYLIVYYFMQRARTKLVTSA